MASVPVRADEPDANECRITNTPTEAAAPTVYGSGRLESWTCGHPPRHFTNPTMISANIDTMNP